MLGGLKSACCLVVAALALRASPARSAEPQLHLREQETGSVARVAPMVVDDGGALVARRLTP
jgi:hypothetical protein